jgi:hypothetical protein
MRPADRGGRPVGAVVDRRHRAQQTVTNIWLFAVARLHAGDRWFTAKAGVAALRHQCLRCVCTPPLRLRSIRTARSDYRTRCGS